MDVSVQLISHTRRFRRFIPLHALLLIFLVDLRRNHRLIHDVLIIACAFDAAFYGMH